jgi:ADP-ribose pyrophosphatase YjhB (NUDIX family)
MIRVFAWLAKAKFTHGALVIVRSSTGELLLVQERLRERGSWGLPGGFMRIRETPRQAAARELREEVGLHVADADLEAVDQYHQPWARHYDHLFTLAAEPAHAKGGASMELRGQGWFTPNRLPPLTRAAAYALRRSELAGLVD